MAHIEQSDIRIFIAKLKGVESALAEIRSLSVPRSHRNLRNHVASDTSTKDSPSARDANSSARDANSSIPDHGSSTDTEKRLATIEETIREIWEAIKPNVAPTPASSLPTNNRATTATTQVPTESVLSSDLPSNANADGLQISETDIPSIDHDNGETSIGRNSQTIAVGINELAEVSTAQVGDTRETIIAQKGDTVRAERTTQVGDTAITGDPTKAGATQPEDASQAGNTLQARDTAQVGDETGATTIRTEDPQQPEDTSGAAAEAGDATKADSLQAGDIAQAAATWVGDTATLSAEADPVPLTEAGVISEAGDTTEAEMDTDAMETESTGATETTETKFSLSPDDFGLGLVPTLVNFLSDPDFSGRVSCTPTLDIDDIEPKDVSLFVDLDYTTNYYSQIYDQPGCSTLTISKEKANFKWPELTEVIQPTEEEFMEFLEGIITQPSTTPISYGGGVPSWPSSHPLDPGDSLRDHPDFKVLNQEYWHVGERFSGTAFHHEDGGLRSCNIIESGIKICLLVPPVAKKKLEDLGNRIAPSAEPSCSQDLRHKNLLVAPSRLAAEQIPFRILCLGPGDMMVTQPYEYHFCVNFTACLSRSINFSVPGESLFPDKMAVCKSCGLYPLHEKYGFSVIATKKRKAAALARPPRAQKVSRSCSKVVSDIQNKSPGYLPLSLHTQQFSTLVSDHQTKVIQMAAILCSKDAIVQFTQLVYAWKNYSKQTKELLPGEDELKYTLRALKQSSSDKLICKFRHRAHFLQLGMILEQHRHGERSAISEINTILKELSWDRKEYKNKQEKASKWRRICSVQDIPTTNQSRLQVTSVGISPYIPIKTISGYAATDFYKLNDKEIKDLHNILPLSLMKAQLEAGKVLENATARGSRNFEFEFERQQWRPDAKTDFDYATVEAMLRMDLVEFV